MLSLDFAKQTSKIKTLLGKNKYSYYPFGIIDVNANLLWKEGYSGQGIKVAVIDSGIYPHKDLGNRIVYRKNYTKANTITESHGTHVAGTIGAAGQLYGMMQNCTFYDLQILDSEGGSEANFALAIDEAIRQNVDVVNMSIGTLTKNQLITNAVKRAYAAGLILVAAAGNSGNNTVMYPGALDECISVANLNIVNDIIDNSSSSNRFVDVCAPGNNVFSLTINNGYAVYSGTSMACPHVTGICGLYLEKSRKENPSFNKYQHRDNVMNMLKANLVDIGPVGFDQKSGYGQIRYMPNVTPSIDFVEISKEYYSYIK